MTAARIRAAPTSDPTTIPAMAPPESPDPDRAPPAAGLPVPDGAGEDVGNTGGMETVVGRSTPMQRLSTFELTQHELVEFTELSAQYEHSPCKLPEKPHSLASFCTALIQLPLSASAGFEHRVKSERISGMALRPGVPHRSGRDTIDCSLIAKSACDGLALTQTSSRFSGSITYASLSAEWHCVPIAESTGLSRGLNDGVTKNGSGIARIEFRGVSQIDARTPQNVPISMRG